MTVKTRSELEDAAELIRTETGQAANTPARVGGYLRDALDSMPLEAELGAGAPTGAEYFVGASHAGLSAERLITDTATIVWDLATGGIARANVPDGSLARAKLANAAGISVLGRSADSAGVLSDIPAPVNDRIFARVSNVLGFFQVTRNMIQSGELITAHYELDSVTNTVLANMAEARFKMRAAGTGTGDPIDGTPAQATAALDAFTSSLKGLAPASGGGTTNYLRADGSWAAPPAAGAAGGSLTGSYPNPTIAVNAVSNTEAADMAEGTIKLRPAGAGSGDPVDGTAAQLLAIALPVLVETFTSGSPTWTKNANATKVGIRLKGSGAGGGALSGGVGGGGGSAGEDVYVEFPASMVPDTLNISIGLAGTAGVDGGAVSVTGNAGAFVISANGGLAGVDGGAGGVSYDPNGLGNGGAGGSTSGLSGVRGRGAGAGGAGGTNAPGGGGQGYGAGGGGGAGATDGGGGGGGGYGDGTTGGTIAASAGTSTVGGAGALGICIVTTWRG